MAVMNRYTIISAEEYRVLQEYRQQQEIERLKRVLAYWPTRNDRPQMQQKKELQ